MATLIVRSRSLSPSLATCSWLNKALLANVGEPPRTLLRLDKLAVTGSSPVAPIEMTCKPTDLRLQ